MSSSTYLTLGHSQALSLFELSSLKLSPIKLSSQLVSLEDKLEDQTLNKLAGVTRALIPLAKTTKDALFADLAQAILDKAHKNVAISNYTSLPLTPKHLRDLKDTVSKTRPVRFLSFELSGHSLVALRKQHIAEFSILEDAGELVIAYTTWIQDSDDWVKRDRKRPYQDIKRGMLPPKIARIMVNLATQGIEGKTLLDPFCGTGTVLMEAMLTGSNVVGSDNDQSAIEGTERNLLWLEDQYQLEKHKYSLYHSGATHLDKKLSPDPINFIATEPYLGPLLEKDNLPSLAKLKNIAKGLDKLYRGSLRSFSRILPNQGRIAMVIPTISLNEREIPTLKIDTIESLGYNYVDSVAYKKPNTVVVRNITVLERA